MDALSTAVADQALLVATIPNIYPPTFLSRALSEAVKLTRKRLIIVLFSRLFDQGVISHVGRWDQVQRLLTFTYVQVAKSAQEAGNTLMDVDILLKGMSDKLPEDIGASVGIVFRISGDSIAAELPISIISLQQMYLVMDSAAETPQYLDGDETEPSSFPVAALGGTFDHLHAGHKILLSMGAWIAKEKLIVGVTADSLLKKKAYAGEMQSLETRIACTRQFLQLFKSDIEYDIVPIDDVYGPTGWDANIQALVVSKETLGGANSIASYRAEKSLPPLETLVIDVISSTSSSLDPANAEALREAKMSSTFIRKWLTEHK